MPRRKTIPAPPLTPTDGEEWGANAVGAKLSTVRFDTDLVRLFRQKAIEKLHNLSGGELDEREAALEPVLEDDYFTARYGAFLEHCGNELIVRLALETLLKVVADARPGRTDVQAFDESRSFQSLELFERFVCGDAD